MYSARAQSTIRFLVMSARPRRMRERPVGGEGQPEGPRGLATPGDSHSAKDQGQVCKFCYTPPTEQRDLARHAFSSSTSTMGWPEPPSYPDSPVGRRSRYAICTHYMP